MSSVEVASLHPVPSIFNTPDTSDTPNNAYLKRNIGEVLARAVKDVLEARPEDPIEYLAHWLYQYRDCELYFYEKATFERELQLMALRLKKLQAEREARLKQLKKNLRQLGDKIRREGWEGKGLFAGLGKGKGKRKGEWSSSDESDSDVFGDDDEDADGTGRKGKKGKRDRYASLENDPEWQFLSEEEKARRRALKDKEYEEERARAKRERQMGGRFTMDEFGNKVWVETIRRGRWSVDEFGNRVFIEGRKGRRGSGYDSYDDLGRRKRKGTYALKESYSAPIPPPDDERIYNSIFILPNISHSRWVQETKKIDEFYPKRRSEVAKRFSQEDKRLSRISHIEGSTLSVASTDTTFTSVTMAATPRQSLALSSHKRSSLSEAAKAAKLARYEREFYAGIRSHAFSPVYARWFVTDPRRLCCRHPVLGRLHYPLPRVVTEPERASTWEEKHHNPQVLYDPEVYVVENPHYDDDVYRDALVLWSEDNQSF